MTKLKLIKLLALAFLGFVAIIAIIPVYVVLINTTRSTSEIISSFSIIPGNAFFENFSNMLHNDNINFQRALVNSAFIAFFSTALAMYFSGLTAYGFAMYDFKGQKMLFNILLYSMMIPGQLVLIGFYQVCYWLGLIDSYIPLIITSVASTSSVYFTYSYIKQMKLTSIVESGRMDGMSELRIYNGLVMPIIKPSLFTMGILSFVGSWNGYMTPLTILTSSNKFTLPVAIAQLKSMHDDIDMGAQYAAIFLSLVPIIIVFIIFSKHVISGMSSGSVKE